MLQANNRLLGILRHRGYNSSDHDISRAFEGRAPQLIAASTDMIAATLLIGGLVGCCIAAWS
jgi:hypothetical protein